MTDEKGVPAAPRRAAVDVIDAVVENMRANLEPLKYSTLAPSRFVVYLHPDEFARIERIIPVLHEQTIRALGEALQRLNHRPIHRKYWDRLAGSAPPVENAAAEWQIEILPDADGELEAGDILVHSELMLPSADEEPGAGQRTRRITTMRSGDKTTRRQETVTPATPTRRRRQRRKPRTRASSTRTAAALIPSRSCVTRSRSAAAASPTAPT